MKILFVCHRLPFPPNRGGKIRPFNMIRHLGKKHSVVVASLAESESELQEGLGLKDYCDELIAELVPKRVRWMRAWKALFTSRPSSVAYFWSPNLERRIQRAVAKTQFDIIFVHCGFMAQYVLPTTARARVLDFGDLDSGKWTDYARWKGLPSSLGYSLEATKMRKYESTMAEHFDQCIVTTRGELEEFSKLNVSVPCTVIPNGVDSNYFRSRSKSRDPSVIVFVGRMDYFPNVDGAVWFAKDIFPVIRRSAPNAQLRIVGSNPTRAVRDLARVSGITVTGHVPDVRPYLEEAALAVAPLRVARGTQNKILEAMAMGVPVVATPPSAKGVNAVAGDDLLVAGDCESFASDVVKIMGNHRLQGDLATAGQKTVLQNHQWSTSMDELENVLKDLVGEAKSPCFSRHVSTNHASIP